MSVCIPVSWGDLIDKVTILEIKSERFDDPLKLANVQKELSLLTSIVSEQISVEMILVLGDYISELKSVNSRLWELENLIRENERRGDFGAAFIRSAQDIRLYNDRRAELKRHVNEITESELTEEKLYRCDSLS